MNRIGRKGFSLPPLAEVQANEERQGNLLREYERRFDKLSEDQKSSRLCSEAGLRLFFYALPSPRGKANQSFCREYTMPRDQEGTRTKGWIQSNVRFGPVSDIKVCNHYGRYSIEVQVQSLFQDRTISWIRIVNGIDKYVREVGTLLLLNRDNGLTLKHRNPRILIVFNCQNSSLDFFDTVNKFVEKKMEESIETKLLLNARQSNPTILVIGQKRRRRTSSMLRIRRWKNGYQFWQKVEDRRKGFNIAWLRTTLINSCTFEQSEDIPEAQSILHCKTMYCYQKVSPSIFITSETEKNWGQWFIMVWFQEESVSERGDLSKARFAPYKNTAKHFSGCSILVQFEARSTKRTAILSNKIKRSYSPRHTACRVHWESDMHENPRSALSKGNRDSETACCS